MRSLRWAGWVVLRLLATSAMAAPAWSGLERAMLDAEAKQEIAGAVTMVASAKKIVFQQATGVADLASGRAMKLDDIFWIASMTKPITGVAILLLQDEGKLQLDDAVAKFIPPFSGLKTPSGRLANLTLRQLLTHTSGLRDATATDALAAKTLADLTPHYLAGPTLFEPGTRWKYCQAGLDTAARVVEIVSGESFDRFLERRVFRPLEMRDTVFYLSEEQLPRLATAYAKNKTTGKLEPVKIRILGERSLLARDRPPLGSGGLFSTAGDYVRFGQMLLKNGVAGGRPLLRAETVQLMHTVQTEGVEGVFPPVKGYGWGIACGIIREPQGVTAMLSPGSFGHSGAYGTHAWIDPRRGAIFVLMVQRSNFVTTDNNEVRRVFQETATASWDDVHQQADTKKN